MTTQQPNPLGDFAKDFIHGLIGQAADTANKYADQWLNGPPNGGSAGEGGAQSRPADVLTAAYAELHLLPDAPIEVVEASHRALARLYHPDKGSKGNAQRMSRINAARTLIKKTLNK